MADIRIKAAAGGALAFEGKAAVVTGAAGGFGAEIARRLEHAIAAAFAARQLADLGARVVKVERPDTGDFARQYDERVLGQSSHFVWCNRSKESLALDLKSDAGLDILRRLRGQADMLVQNLAPGTAARMGLDYEPLSALHPRLIVCDISGYGQDGPDRDRKAYNLPIQSGSGFLSTTGTPDAPAKAGCSIADIAAGIYAIGQHNHSILAELGLADAAVAA
jgi:itaconate CoA-transferase